MSKDLEILDNNDVVSVIDVGEAEFVSGNTLKIQQLLEESSDYIENYKKTTNNSNICLQGIECEVLRQNNNSKGWRKGKIKFVIQFEPEETSNNANSNTLDDIRVRMDSTN